MDFLSNLLSLLTTAPGNLVYILALAFTLLGAFPGAVLQWRVTGYPQSRRLLGGLALLLAGQLAMFTVSALVWANVLSANALPTLDRAVLVFSLIWIVWLWAFPDSSRIGDTAGIILSVLTLIGLVIGLNFPSQPNTFNASVQGLLWVLFALVVSLAGAVFLVLRKPKHWGTGLAITLLIAVGCLLDRVTPNSGDYSGFIRLMSLAAYPLILTILMRFPIPSDGSESDAMAGFHSKASNGQDASTEESDTSRQRRRYSTDPKTLQTMLTLAAELDADKINQQIARSVSQALLADLCFLIYIAEDRNTLNIASGYDLIREENLEGGMMSKDSVPSLGSAVLRGRALRLPASSTSSDMKGLADMLGLGNPGNMLVVPINSEKGPIGSLMLLSPYSNRLWSSEDQTFVSTIATAFVPIVERGRRMDELKRERERARASADEANAQTMRLQASNNDLNNQLGELKSQLQQLALLKAQQRDVSEKIEKLEKDNEKLRARIEAAKAAEGTTSGSAQLEAELRLTLQEMAYLQNQLANANIKILELEKRPVGALTTDQAEIIASISQELRQPMSSIIGYADLLLGESVGILGALQRKFIERVRASTERIGSLVDDLIQMTTIEAGLSGLNPETVDVNLIIDNAMAYTSSQLREKNTVLRIDVPENIQPIQSDRDALQQILIHLIQNASGASPVDGTVTLRVRTVEENSIEYIQIQVTDTGGGIPKDDLTRVFSRHYRADNVLIQGVGDTGVGLSIAKTLTEAQGGRISVETELNSGSTFTVILPLKNQPVLETQSES